MSLMVTTTTREACAEQGEERKKEEKEQKGMRFLIKLHKMAQHSRVASSRVMALVLCHSSDGNTSGCWCGHAHHGRTNSRAYLFRVLLLLLL